MISFLFWIIVMIFTYILNKDKIAIHWLLAIQTKNLVGDQFLSLYGFRLSKPTHFKQQNTPHHTSISTIYDNNFNLKIARLSSYLNFFRLLYSIILCSNWVLPTVTLSIFYKAQKFGLSLATNTNTTLTVYVRSKP